MARNNSINTSIFTSDGRVKPGMGLKRVVKEDLLRKAKKEAIEARKEVRYINHRFSRLIETYVRFVIRAEHKYKFSRKK